MPKDMPFILRISAVEYADVGYELDHAITLCRAYKQAGVDMFKSAWEMKVIRLINLVIFTDTVPFAGVIKDALNVPEIAVGR